MLTILKTENVKQNVTLPPAEEYLTLTDKMWSDTRLCMMHAKRKNLCKERAMQTTTANTCAGDYKTASLFNYCIKQPVF